MTILTVINETELINLADIISPYFIPIVPVIPLKHCIFPHTQSLYKYYDNIITTFIRNFEKILFLLEFAETFNANLVSIFHDLKEGDGMQETNMIYSPSRQKNFCKSIYYASFSKHKE